MVSVGAPSNYQPVTIVDVIDKRNYFTLHFGRESWKLIKVEPGQLVFELKTMYAPLEAIQELQWDGSPSRQSKILQIGDLLPARGNYGVIPEPEDTMELMSTHVGSYHRRWCVYLGNSAHAVNEHLIQEWKLNPCDSCILKTVDPV